jgi:hypothetical protein
MTPAEQRVRELVDKWLQSLELHLKYATLSDEAYWQVQPWAPHQRPARWILELAYARAQDLKHLLATRLAAGDAAFAEAIELTGFLSNLVGAQHLERFIPLADPATENAAAFVHARLAADGSVAAPAFAPLEPAGEPAVEHAHAPSADADEAAATAAEAATDGAPVLELPDGLDAATVLPEAEQAHEDFGSLHAGAGDADPRDAVEVAYDEPGDATAATAADPLEAPPPADAGESSATASPPRYADASIAHVFTPTLTLTISMNAGLEGAIGGSPAWVGVPGGTSAAASRAAVENAALPAVGPGDASTAGSTGDGDVPTPQAAIAATDSAPAAAPEPAPAIGVEAESDAARAASEPVATATSRVAVASPAAGHGSAARVDAPPVQTPPADAAHARAPEPTTTPTVARPTAVPGAAAQSLPSPTPRPEAAPLAAAASPARPTAPAVRRAMPIDPPKPVVPPTPPAPAFVTSPPLTLAALEARIATPRSPTPPAAARSARASALAGLQPTTRASSGTPTDATDGAARTAPAQPAARPAAAPPAPSAVATPRAAAPVPSAPQPAAVPLPRVEHTGTTTISMALSDTVATRLRDSTVTTGASGDTVSMRAPDATVQMRSLSATMLVPALDATVQAPALAPSRPESVPSNGASPPVLDTARAAPAKGARKDGRTPRHASRGTVDAATSQTVVADAVRLLKWGKEWHELADAIARMAGRPPVGEVRRMLRTHKSDIQRQARH